MTDLQLKGLKELNIDVNSYGYPLEIKKIENGIEVLFDGKKIVIGYGKDNEFYRAFALLNAKGLKESFEIRQQCHFDTLSIMADNSRNAVMTVETAKLWIRKMALMGYNQLQMYTEDTFEVENHPFFGYKRGKYLQSEIKEIVEYAEIFGIEVIPAIQTLAHFTALKHWQPFVEHIDCEDILMVDDDRTYQLIEDILIAVKKCYKSRRINIGMDEAHMLGLGKFLDKNGYEPRFSILTRHLKKVLELLEKHGFEPMMWSDMFFRASIAPDYFYDTPKKFPEEMKKQIPDGVKLIYWDYYGNGRKKYECMIDTHLQLEKEIWFAGGVWTWMGFAPMNVYSNVCTKAALKSCIKKGIKNVIMTLWGDDGAECQMLMGLSGLSYASELAYGNEKNVKQVFKSITGVSFDDWNKLDYPNIIELPYKVHNSNCCKYYLYNDYFFGIMDPCVKENCVKIYQNYTIRLRMCANKYPEWSEIFTSMADLCSALAVKSTLGLRTRELYKNKDKQGLKELINDYKLAYKRIEKFYNSLRTVWYKYNKPNGFEVQDVRLGGLLLRTKSCITQIKAYADGKIDKILELEEECLPYQGDESKDAFLSSYNKIFSPCDIAHIC